MEIRIRNENEDFYFCEIVNENGEILEIIGISRLGVRIADLFEEQKQSLVLKQKQQDTLTKS